MYANAIFNFIGAYAFACYAYDTLKSPMILAFCFLKKNLGFKEIDLMDKYGDWVAITGSTDGIGKAYARDLARRGFNIILISRNISKLEKVAKEIEKDFYVKTKIIVADLSQQNACKHIEKELQDVPVRILVNNAGQAKGIPETLDQHTMSEIWSIINTNMGALTQLTRFFINRLKSKKQTGLIVNVSSGMNYTPIPKIALYAATKTFVSELTLALQAEARPFGIEVQLLTPYIVNTKINSYAEDTLNAGPFIPNPITYARSAVDKLGKVNHTTGYFWHAVQSTFNGLLYWRYRLFAISELIDLVILRSNGDAKWKFKILKHLFCDAFIVGMIIAYFMT